MKSIVHAGARTLLMLVAGIIAVPIASAQPLSDTVYAPRLKLDIPLLATTGGAGLVSLFFDDDVEKSCTCVTAELNGLDRSTAGRQSDGIDKTSNFFVGFAFGLPATLTYFDWKGGGDGAWMDSIVVADAVMTNLAFNQWVKIAANRPRPMMYELTERGVDRKTIKRMFTEPDNFLSFYSQHTSMTFAAGLSYARTYALRHPDSRYRWLVYTVALANGVTVAAMRVGAGRHFPTDVITGAAVGSAIGLAIPWLHPKQNRAGAYFSPINSGAMVSIKFPLN